MVLRPWLVIDYKCLASLSLTKVDALEPKNIKEALASSYWRFTMEEDWEYYEQIEHGVLWFHQQMQILFCADECSRLKETEMAQSYYARLAFNHEGSMKLKDWIFMTLTTWSSNSPPLGGFSQLWLLKIGVYIKWTSTTPFFMAIWEKQCMSQNLGYSDLTKSKHICPLHQSI